MGKPNCRIRMEPRESERSQLVGGQSRGKHGSQS